MYTTLLILTSFAQLDASSAAWSSIASAAARAEPKELTQDDIVKIRIEQLATLGRPAVDRAYATAKLRFDRSKQGEYDAAKQRVDEAIERLELKPSAVTRRAVEASLMLEYSKRSR